MDLPFVDVHSRVVPAASEEVWRALIEYVETVLATPGRWPRRLFTLLLGTSPAAGFAPTVDEPGRRLRLTGRHRFSRYELVFEVQDLEPGTARLSALTYAAFPGPHGLAYRTVVMRSRAHPVLTRRMLDRIASRTASPRRR